LEWLRRWWSKRPFIASVGMFLAVAAILALIWPITDLIAAHDVGMITGLHRAASLQAAREAVRTQLLTLGAGVFAAGALVYTARNFTLSRSTFRATEARVLNERFMAIAAQLGGDQASVRLAGVHAMAGLADDWEDNRQTCVDVLCAYLRMPYEPDPGANAPAADRQTFGANREVRHTVIRVIGAHLRQGALRSWQGLNLDFTGVEFDGGDFSGARISGVVVDFTGARFSGGTVGFTGVQFSGGTVDFDRAQFSGGVVDFTGSEFSGGIAVNFGKADFTGGAVRFDTADFRGGRVSFGNAEFSGGTVSFTAARFSGGTVYFGQADFSGGKVSFESAQFVEGMVGFTSARFSGGRVSFGNAEFSGGTVSFTAAQFSGGTVFFGKAQFSGGRVSFGFAQFSGGTVDLSGPANWSHPPTFSFTGTPPSGVALP
jgi:uncharacterized protein YjbI with pentapeptide repeats